MEVAEEALRTAEAMPSDLKEFDDPPFELMARGTLMAALAATGAGNEAGRLFDGWTLSLREHDDDEDPEIVWALAEAFATTLAAVPEPAEAAELLGRVEHLAERMTEPAFRVLALARIAEAWAAGTDADHGARLYDSVVTLVRQHTDAPADDLAFVAQALHRMRPAATENRNRVAQARAVLTRAVLARRGATRLLRRRDDAPSPPGIVLALVVEGQVDEAQRVTESRQRENDRFDLADMWLTIADGRAREGRAAEAWAALEQGWEHQGADVNDRSGARVATLLTEAGAADQLETLLLGRTAPWHGGVIEALAALAGELAATDPARALRILQRAERGQSATGGTMAESLSAPLAVFASALATVGRPDEAERLLRRIDEPKAHAWGHAAVAVAVARHEPDRALRLAGRAVDVVPALEGGGTVRANVLVNAAQAMARAGAADAAADVVERLSAEDVKHRTNGYYTRVAWAEVSGGLWPHDPELAGLVFDDLLHATDLRSRSVRENAYLLATVIAHDGDRGARVWQALPLWTGPRNTGGAEVGGLLALVAGTVDPAEGRRHVAWSDRGQWKRRDFQPGAVEALVHAALGDLEAARTIARGRETAEGRAVALTILAEYVAQIPIDRLVTPIFAGEESCVLTARRLAALLLPPSSGPDHARARAFLAEALTPDGWYHAVQVLALLDPDTVLRVREVVFAHLGLDDRGAART